MNIINLNSSLELSAGQISFAENVILCGEDNPQTERDSFSVLAKCTPIFLVNQDTQKEYGDRESENRDFPSTDILGFYNSNGRVLGESIPVIGLCLENILKYAKNDDELSILIAKVLIHELAHAKMSMHPSAEYKGRDEFYKWMEEPMANLLTLKCFQNYHRHYCHFGKPIASIRKSIAPLDYVKDFISKQPPNYRLGLDLFEHRIWHWWLWRNNKKDISKKANEKTTWLNYVKTNVGTIDSSILNFLFDSLTLDLSEHARRLVNDYVNEKINLAQINSVIHSQNFYSRDGLSEEIVKYTVTKNIKKAIGLFSEDVVKISKAALSGDPRLR